VQVAGVNGAEGFRKNQPRHGHTWSSVIERERDSGEGCQEVFGCSFARTVARSNS
jgi:hypothetical protein